MWILGLPDAELLGAPNQLVEDEVCTPLKNMSCQWKLAIFYVGDTSFSNGCFVYNCHLSVPVVCPKNHEKNHVIVGVVFQRVPFFFVVQAITDSMMQSVFFEPSQTDVISDYNLPN